jgi:hypothetical protein
MSNELDVGSIFLNRGKRAPLGPVATDAKKLPETPQEIAQAKLEGMQQAAGAMGFMPTEFEDLPGEGEDGETISEQVESFHVASPEKPVYGNPTVMKDETGKPVGAKAPPIVNKPAAPVPQLPDSGFSPEEEKKLSAEFTKAFGKDRKEAITNKLEDMRAAKYTVTRVGKAYSREDAEDAPTDLKNAVRFDNISGILPYRNTSFKGRIYINEFTARELGALAKAFRAESYTLLFDILNRHVSAPYRHLTVADHRQIMYYYLIESYPPVKLEGITWHSRLYGTKQENTTAYDFHITETAFDMEEKEWSEYEALGFTLPRVYDLELFQTLAEQGNEEDFTLLTLAQYLDPYHPEIVPFVKAAAGANSTAPRLQGRLDYLDNKPMKWTAKVEEFRTRVNNFGMTEEVSLTANVKDMKIAQAISFLEKLEEPDEAQQNELARLRGMLPPQDELDKFLLRYDELTQKSDRSEEENAELHKMEAENPWDKTFTPVAEMQVFNRKPWTFFPFLPTVNAA